MERVNYNMGSGNAETPAKFINKFPGKLIDLIDLLLEQQVILADIKLQNLFVKCSSSHSCELGVIDLDKKFVSDINSRWYPGWYPLDRLLNILTGGGITEELAKQYMVLMVCFVGLNNKLNIKAKTELLQSVRLLSKSGVFNADALDQMLQHEELKKQIKHYLGFNQDRTRDIGEGFFDEYITGELYAAVVRDTSKSASSTPDSSLGGGKSRRKHKKTRKRKPKSRKMRRKRSLLNRVKAWDR
jgi:hypothetical protein